MEHKLSRRQLLPAFLTAAAPLSATSSSFRGDLCLFSKPVPQLNWRELAQAAKAAGFGGIDLTVRKRGHVTPERVKEDLPKAVDAIRAEGLKVPMITTELLSADDPALLAMPRIKMLAVKDMYWKKTATGWSDTDYPLGQGMCRYAEFLKMCAQGGFQRPISLHLEYEIPGVSGRDGIALSRAKTDDVMTAAERDLDNLKSLLRGAYEGA
jgi:sugar phosphate isomerase/epimerase